ncbi:MAG: hypothetical protein HY051_01825 [Candidatus Aenigmarchaeota archaeon]|nr:hypothetical protein [Candidatus Aenigmarchaeota archaeon]
MEEKKKIKFIQELGDMRISKLMPKDIKKGDIKISKLIPTKEKTKKD